ncbi:hypothetical protein E2C01_054407 [Portunus trituberculatus]|uniref:Uncharacterized protein n=1 Tax=Portunus trituberculatus TaxID=210409 RepID=A0A5B7GUX9_PORTR|nr:hypothetical protein [Portunus trituberculatus]
MAGHGGGFIFIISWEAVRCRGCGGDRLRLLGRHATPCTCYLATSDPRPILPVSSFSSLVFRHIN